MLRMEQHLNILARMKDNHIALELTGRYDPDRLTAFLGQLENSRIDTSDFEHYKLIQTAMLDDPAFMEHYQALIALGVPPDAIHRWLEEKGPDQLRMTDYPPELIGRAIFSDIESVRMQQDYMRYYLTVSLPESTLETVRANLNFLSIEKNIRISLWPEGRRKLLEYPCVHRCLRRVHIETSIDCLEKTPLLVRLLDKLAEQEIEMNFSIEELRRFERLNSDDFARIDEIHAVLGASPARMKQLIALWLDNGGHPGDLPILMRKLGSLTPEQQSAALDTRLSYLNLLYGGALGGVDFRAIPGHALPVFAYALANHQSRFLKMIVERFDLLRDFPRDSMIFAPAFFSRIRLNSMTEEDVAACKKQPAQIGSLERLDQKLYTFAELCLLANLPSQYAALYASLNIARIDDRLIALRQLSKRKLLPDSLTDDQRLGLAGNLSHKPLMRWKEVEFAHIEGITPRLCLDALCVYDRIMRFIPDLSTAAELAFVVRRAADLEAFGDWRAVREQIEQIDTAWHALREALQLDDAFVSEHRESIFRFLMQNGAGEALQYARSLNNPSGFYRIVTAELMGKYDALKYFGNDLNREISYPITEGQKRRWMENLSKTSDGITIEERDDFFTTLHIGAIPEHTCLDYRNGMHRDCLLACFDSNKKILFATLNGRPVARAMIRLTKGRFTRQNRNKPALEFADLRRNDEPEREDKSAEELILFLERSYVNGLDEKHIQIVNRMFAELTLEKVMVLGAKAVLSANYSPIGAQLGYASMAYHVYISKSKAGLQYLDSMGGSNGTESEGKYHRGLFLLPAADDQAKA